ncbi:MAG: SIS domain-containing protein, partial [Anaerolineae bacterium]|nr:SIS domain-containing protein [Anaerolineae bacterium]
MSSTDKPTDQRTPQISDRVINTIETGHVREQVFSRPGLLREFSPKFDAATREALSEAAAKHATEVHIFGCGDSHHAGLTTRMAFLHWAGLHTEAHTALDFSRYTAPWLRVNKPAAPLAIGISISGEVVRTVEGMSLAREAGAYTLGITCRAESRLTKLADAFVNIETPMMDAPRIRTYLASQIALYMAALRLGEVRGTLTAKQAQAIRDGFQKAADVGEATHPAISET